LTNLGLASVNKKAAHLTNDKFPKVVPIWCMCCCECYQLAALFSQVFLVLCAAHAINLVLKDLGQLTWISKLVSAAKEVVQFIRRYHSTLALYREHSKLHAKKELVVPGE
jgi:hypothetical protein